MLISLAMMRWLVNVLSSARSVRHVGSTALSTLMSSFSSQMIQSVLIEARHTTGIGLRGHLSAITSVFQAHLVDFNQLYAGIVFELLNCRKSAIRTTLV